MKDVVKNLKKKAKNILKKKKKSVVDFRINNSHP